jgi:hypothetical protein
MKLIQTLSRRFLVILVRHSDMDADILVCRDLWEEGEREYLLVAVKNPDLVYRCAPFFAHQAANRPFTDFIECFSRDGVFYIVFAYYDKPLFADKFDEGYFFLEERMEMGKSLLARIVLQNAPPGILYEALQERNLLLDDTLQIYFNYALNDIASQGLHSMDRVQIELARIFRVLLRKELDTQSVEEIRLFIEDMERCSFADYMDIYEAFDRVYDMVKQLQAYGEIDANSFLFRCWERIKKVFSYAKPVVAGLILATALGYLIYTLAVPEVKQGRGPASIETIGTVRAE